MTVQSINHDIGSDLVVVTDFDRQSLLCIAIQTLVKENKDPDLDLKTSNSETKDLIIPFKKKISSQLSGNKTDILQYNKLKKMKKLSSTTIINTYKSFVLFENI